jgi:hypothetical protein
LPDGVREEVFAVVVNALKQECPVRVTWLEANAATACRSKVTPERLILAPRQWALKGHSTFHRKTHRFDLAQILEAELAEDIELDGG